MGGYEIAGNLRLKAEEVTIGGSNFSIGGSKYFSVTEDELEDFPPPAVTKRGPLRLDSKGRVIEWRNQSESGDDLHVSCESKAPVFVDEIFDYGVDEDGNIDVRTVGEILFGDGSGRPVRGIMTAMVESGAFAEKFPPGRRNRAARRAERKKARGR